MIFLFMYGGPSHIDTFDYKPAMIGMDSKTVDVKTFGRGGIKNQGRIVEPRWKFKQYGQCGKWVSDLFPHLAKLRRRHRFHPLDDRRFADPRLGHAADELRQNPQRQPLPRLVGQLRPGQRERKPAGLRRHARSARRPDQRREELVQRLHAGHLSKARCCASHGAPILDLQPPGGHERKRPSAICSTRCKRTTTTTCGLRGDNSDLAARIASYELAFKMQSTAPEAVDLSQETAETLGALRPEREADARLRPPVPAGPAAGRARRAVRPALLRRQPQRRQLGRPRRPGEEPQLALPAKPTSRSPACSPT